MEVLEPVPRRRPKAFGAGDRTEDLASCAKTGIKSGPKVDLLEMAAEEGAARGGPPSENLPLAEIVPRRAVLTELARGFLLSQDADPERAKRFASSFLRERAGPPGPGRIVPMNRRPTVHRGVDSTVEGGASRWP
jgi:hypothetical protein